MHFTTCSDLIISKEDAHKIVDLIDNRMSSAMNDDFDLIAKRKEKKKKGNKMDSVALDQLFLFL